MKKQKKKRMGYAPRIKKVHFQKMNRNYKDTLFCMLFRDKQRLLSLYNAVNHSDYNNPDELQVVTLENAIYMNMKNDIAFLIHDELHLYEHQSTVNPNMPLRNLFYVAREYQKLVDSRTLYGGKLSLIPAPHFLVFYNGEKNQPQQRRMKLSEAYLTGEAEPELELTVTVLNINSGNNDFLREKCQSLNEYMLYIESVRSYIKKGMDLEDAVDLAVNECIEQGILAEFLRKHRVEAMEMGALDFDEWEKYKLRKADFEAGQEVATTRMVEKLMEKQGLSLEEACELLDFEVKLYHETKKLMEEDELYGS